MVEQVEGTLIRFGLVPQSLDRVRPKLPRWVAFLRSQGVTDLNSARAQTLVTFLVLQERDDRGGEVGHHLRNLVGVRPYKPFRPN